MRTRVNSFDTNYAQVLEDERGGPRYYYLCVRFLLQVKTIFPLPVPFWCANRIHCISWYEIVFTFEQICWKQKANLSCS